MTAIKLTEGYDLRPKITNPNYRGRNPGHGSNPGKNRKAENTQSTKKPLWANVPESEVVKPGITQQGKTGVPVILHKGETEQQALQRSADLTAKRYVSSNPGSRVALKVSLPKSKSGNTGSNPVKIPKQNTPKTIIHNKQTVPTSSTNFKSGLPNYIKYDSTSRVQSPIFFSHVNKEPSSINPASPLSFAQSSSKAFSDFSGNLNKARDFADFPGASSNYLLKSAEAGSYALTSGVALGVYGFGKGVFDTITNPGNAVEGVVKYGANIIKNPVSTVSKTYNNIGRAVSSNPVAFGTEAFLSFYVPGKVVKGYETVSKSIDTYLFNRNMKLPTNGQSFEVKSYAFTADKVIQKPGVQLDIYGNAVPDATLNKLVPNLAASTPESPLRLPKEYYDRIASEEKLPIKGSFKNKRLDDTGFQNLNIPGGGKTSTYASVTDNSLINPDYVRVYNIKTGGEYDIKALDLAKELKTNNHLSIVGRPLYGKSLPKPAIVDLFAQDVLENPVSASSNFLNKKGQSSILSIKKRFGSERVSPIFETSESQTSILDTINKLNPDVNNYVSLRTGVLGFGLFNKPLIEKGSNYVSSVNISKSISNVNQLDKVSVLGKVASITSQKSFIAQASSQYQIQKKESIEKITPVYKTSTAQAQIVDSAQMAETKSKTESIMFMPEPVIKKINTSKIKNYSDFNNKRSSRIITKFHPKSDKIIRSVFRVEVGKPGNQIYRNFKGVDFKKVLKQAKFLVDNSAAASLKVEGAGKSEFSAIKNILGNRYSASKKGFRFNQKNTFRISSAGEKKDITSKGLWSRKKFKLFGGLF